MLIQPNDVSGDGGFILPAAKLPTWISGMNELWSFAFWHYRYNDAANKFRVSLLLELNTDNYFLIRNSSSSLAGRIRAAGVSYDYKQAGGSGNATHWIDQWELCTGYFDPTGVTLDTKIWNIREGVSDPNNSTTLTFPVSPPASADLVSSGDLSIGNSHAHTGSSCQYGIHGGLTFWKGVKINEADITTMWNSRNPQPWTLPASGNLPGPTHDGIFALLNCPGGNTRPRGGSNVNGPMMGDDVDGDECVLVYRNETGIVDTGVMHTHESGLTFPTGTRQQFWNPYRNNP